MQVVLQGLEAPSHKVTLRSLLDSFPDFRPKAGVSFKSLRSRRLSPRHVQEVHNDVAPVVMEAGISQARLTEDEAVRFAKEYYDFCLSLDEIELIIEFDHPSMGADARAEIAEKRSLDERIVPVWEKNEGIPVLQDLYARVNRVSIGVESLKDQRVPAVVRGSKRPDTLSVALSMSRLDDAKRSGFTMVSTGAWLAPATYGEFIFYDGTQFHRDSPVEREHQRKRFAEHIAAAGFDMDKIMNDEVREVTRLTGYSFLQWARDLSGNSLDPDPEDHAVALIPSGENVGRGVKNVREQRMLPVFGHTSQTSVETNADGQSEIRERRLLRTSHETIRVCNSCFLAGVCPAYEADASCAYSFPVEVRTQAQLRELLNSIIELQASRVAFARFSEEINGGHPDDTVSKEMDRLFSMAEKLKKVEERRERLTVSVEHEESGGSGGVLSAIFGKSVPQPEQPAIEADTIIAEVVDE